MSKVDLGFIEACEEWLLTNKFFPSKVGGKPAWLELKNIPDPHDLLCLKCKEPTVFLCQVYASNDSVEHAFHRTIFLFICPKGECCVENSADNLIVFRSQLPIQNNFYSPNPPNESVKSEEIASPVHLCRICGCRGPSACSKCKAVFYCGSVHQRTDWKFRHKRECSTEVRLEESSIIENVLFAEKELVIEAEDSESELREVKESSAEAEARQLKEYEEMVKSGKIGLANVSDAEIEQYAGEENVKEDKVFNKFKERIKNDQDQVLRYDRGGSPLWISAENQITPDNIPNCSVCQEPRTFEFQVMPQLLNDLNTADLDWGIISVYTCSKDCDIGPKYAKEFVFKQDLTKDSQDL